MGIPGFGAEASLYKGGACIWLEDTQWSETNLIRIVSPQTLNPNVQSFENFKDGSSVVISFEDYAAWMARIRCMRAVYSERWYDALARQWYGGGVIGYSCDPSLPGCKEICR